jgi:hypothetical protein
MLDVECSMFTRDLSELDVSQFLPLCFFASLRYKKAMENERKTLDDRQSGS